MNEEEAKAENTQYKGLGSLLHSVRWTQHLLAIIAEVLILLSFAMSGMDVSLGGVMAKVPLLKILWAAMFALGIDTAFALSWVRVRQCVVKHQWLALIWNILLALGMSVIVFQPLALQLLQQSLDMSFNQALASLGIDIVFLTYARSGVAVFLGAILAMTNVESEMEGKQVSTPKRKLIWLETVLNKVAPIVSTDTAQPAQVTITEEKAAQLPPVSEPENSEIDSSPQQRQQKVSKFDFRGLSNYEKVVKVLGLFPNLSDRELGKLSKVSAATAKKHREAYKRQSNS